MEYNTNHIRIILNIDKHHARAGKPVLSLCGELKARAGKPVL